MNHRTFDGNVVVYVAAKAFGLNGVITIV